MNLPAEKVKIGRRDEYEWREKDVAFAMAWEEAVEAVADARKTRRSGGSVMASTSLPG